MGFVPVVIAVATLIILCIPLGNYMGRVFITGKRLGIERGPYHVISMCPETNQH